MKSRTFLLVAMLTITGCGTRTTPTHPQPRQSLSACLAGVGKVSHSYHALDIKNRYGLLVAEISTFPTPAKAAAFAAQLRVSGEAVGRHVVLWDGEPYGLDSEGRDAVKSCLGA